MMRFVSLTAACENRADGITLLGNAAPVAGSIGFRLLCEKSPPRSSIVGITVPELVVEFRWRKDSHAKNRKLLSRLMGPPRLAPNWFRFNVGLSTSPFTAKKE